MERTAKQILHDKKLEKNEKRFMQQLKGEAADRSIRFESEDAKRHTAKTKVIQKNNAKDLAGYKRFTVDFKATE